jgi:O-antigen/teichoic acid export membrane protein
MRNPFLSGKGRASDYFWKSIRKIIKKGSVIRTLERNSEKSIRAAFWTAASSVFTRAFTFLALLITLRIALPYLGAERFGVLSTATGVAGLIGFADFGISSGLVSQVAHLQATCARQQLRYLISKALIILLLLGMGVGFIVTLVFIACPLEWIARGTDAKLLEELRATLIVAGLVSALLIPLNSVQRIYLGMQEAYVWNCASLPFLGATLGLIFLLPILHASVPWFLAVSLGVPSLVAIPLLASLHRRGLIVSRNEWKEAMGVDLRPLRGESLTFLGIQVVSQVGWASDSLFISAFLGPESVTRYAVLEKLFLIVSIPLNIITMPLWSLYSAAYSTSDFSFIKKTFLRSLVINLAVSVICSVILVIFNAEIVKLFTKGHIEIDFWLFVEYAVWVTLGSANLAIAIFLNGTQRLWPQLWSFTLFAVLATACKVFFLRETGLIGLPLINIVVFGIAILLPYITVFRRRAFGRVLC